MSPNDEIDPARVIERVIAVAGGAVLAVIEAAAAVTVLLAIGWGLR